MDNLANASSVRPCGRRTFVEHSLNIAQKRQG